MKENYIANKFTEIKNRLNDDINELTQTIEEIRQETIEEIKSYDARVEKFENMVETVQSKFKRIGSDWIKIKDAIEVQSKQIKTRQELMTKDHEVFSRIICSLVELEYIQ